jgi:hypothetical protein
MLKREASSVVNMMASSDLTGWNPDARSACSAAIAPSAPSAPS